MAGLDSINSGAGSDGGHQPGRDEENFNVNKADPAVHPKGEIPAPPKRHDASGLPGTSFKSQKPNPQDGGGHKKFAGASHEAWSNIPGGGSAGKPKIPGAGGGGPAGAAGKAGGGKAAFAQKAAEGLQQGLDKLQQGDIVGGAKDAVKGAAGAAGDLAADKLFYVMIQWALQTFTLSILIGWNLLLFLPWIIGAITGVKISLQLWQKAVIIAMDAIIVGIILLLLIIFTVTFCYGVSGKEFSLTAFSVNPVGYVAGQAAQYVLPQEVVDFCSSVSGTKAGDFGGGGATDNYGGGTVDGDGDVTDPNYVPVRDGCGGDPSGLCKATNLNDNDRCTPPVVSRCNSPEYEAFFNQGLELYHSRGGKDIPGADMKALLKSIASAERHCTAVGVCSRTKTGAIIACGMMQFIPDSARLYAPRCGVTVGSPFDSWANGNPDIQICMAAAHLYDNYTGACGSQIRNIAAGYNAGPGNCKRNTKSGCAVSSCDGTSPLRKWECSCDRSASNYKQTTDYARLVSGCYYNAF